MRTGRDLTLSDIKKIIKLREKGLSMRQIADLVGFSAMTVQRLIHSPLYKNKKYVTMNEGVDNSQKVEKINQK